MKNRYYEHIDVDFINNAVINDPTSLVEEAEEKYNKQIYKICDDLLKNRKNENILFLSGPSGSTKTTTANKMSDRIIKSGENAIVISLDDFFVNRENLPLLPNGEYDYESIKTVDINTLKMCLNQLSCFGESDFPIFDFETGKRSEKKRNIISNKDTIIIIEGIHALNPMIIDSNKKSSFKTMYVSPHSDYIKDNNIILAARNIRLIRRTVRDYNYRANPVADTLKMWVNVVNSELKNIIPYSDTSDYRLNSTIAYEPCVFKHFFYETVNKSDVMNIPLICELTEILDEFVSLPLDLIPQNTVLHEFI